MNRIFICDLTHTALGISALSFPLGASFVASYAKANLQNEYDIQLFKFPDALAKAFAEHPPKILGFSSFSWNFELSYRVAQWAKKKYPGITVIFGGPNFPTEPEEQHKFLSQRPAIDFYIQNEGEIGFVETVRLLGNVGHNATDLKATGREITNCCYIDGNKMVSGKIERIKDVNIIPSPYLTGMLDPFFESPLFPLLETTRGCPFSCSFCADGLDSKNKIVRFNHERIREELEYIASHVKNIEELTITDLNFGMYKQDKLTAEAIADVHKKYSWPTIMNASSGKNQPRRIIETAKILQGMWAFGASIQSTDETVLKNISRSNISIDSYKEITDFINSTGAASSMSEVILALPGDSKKKHEQSIRYCIENGIDSVRLFQAMMLLGTGMASQKTRDMHGLSTRFRIIPGCVGEYKFGNENIRVGEIDEIIVSGNNMSFDDYISCRSLDLIVESFFNNRLFDEILKAIEVFDVNVFDVFEYINDHKEVLSPKLSKIFDNFRRETAEDLFLSQKEAELAIQGDDYFADVMSGIGGNNELLNYRAQLYLELEEMALVLVKTAKIILSDRGLLTDQKSDYLDQSAQFEIIRKASIHNQTEERCEKFNYDFSTPTNPTNGIAHPAMREPVETKLRFFHTDDQRRYINNSLNLYKHHPGGIGRMIQRIDLKLCFRQVEKVA